jgi:hypothetical protein
LSGLIVPRSVVARARRAVVATLTVLGLCVVSLLATPSPAYAQTPPGPPTGNVPGAQGPCGVDMAGAYNNVVTNGFFPNQKIYIINPTGSGSPRTGGTCNGGSRPVVVLAHGWNSNQENWTNCAASPQSEPNFYFSQISNLVSNGHIVVFPNYCGGWGTDIAGIFTGNPAAGEVPYSQVLTGMVGVIDSPALNGRMNREDIGFWGHSYGAGMVPYLAEQAHDRGWGSNAFWAATYAPFYSLRTGTPYDVPSHIRVLQVVYQHDEFCWRGVLAWCITEQASLDIYSRWPASVRPSRIWPILVNSDCRTTSPCETPVHVDFRADHYVPGDKSLAPDFTPVIDPPTHLNYYGSHRNVQALSDCVRAGDAPPAGDDCFLDLTFMGRWSDNVAATPATFPYAP